MVGVWVGCDLGHKVRYGACVYLVRVCVQVCMRDRVNTRACASRYVNAYGYLWVVILTSLLTGGVWDECVVMTGGSKSLVNYVVDVPHMQTRACALASMFVCVRARAHEFQWVMAYACLERGHTGSPRGRSTSWPRLGRTLLIWQGKIHLVRRPNSSGANSFYYQGLRNHIDVYSSWISCFVDPCLFFVFEIQMNFLN